MGIYILINDIVPLTATSDKVLAHLRSQRAEKGLRRVSKLHLHHSQELLLKNAFLLLCRTYYETSGTFLNVLFLSSYADSLKIVSINFLNTIK